MFAFDPEDIPNSFYPEDEGPHLLDLYGIAPDITGGVPSEVFIKKMRCPPKQSEPEPDPFQDGVDGFYRRKVGK